jgi:hypothetical protein
MERKTLTLGARSKRLATPTDQPGEALALPGVFEPLRALLGARVRIQMRSGVWHVGILRTIAPGWMSLDEVEVIGKRRRGKVETIVVRVLDKDIAHVHRENATVERLEVANG